jgi:hypothetical protein
MAQRKSISENNSLWIPIELWNLNELFTTESISPISFYRERNFGNPVNRNQGIIEDTNNLVLFNEAVESSILLEISNTILDNNFLTEIKTSKKVILRSFEYSKTIYLKRGHFNIHFSSKERLNEFLNNTFMLLEVKTTYKYRNELSVILAVPGQKAFYQGKLISEISRFEPYFDKSFNQIKGLIYGYLIGSIGTLGEKEQTLISELLKLKNSIGSSNTDIALSENHNGFWLINIHKQVKDCQRSYFDNFGIHSDVLDILQLRLEEIDNLNKMRCKELSEHKIYNHKKDFKEEQNSLENIKQKIYQYECENEINSIRKELEKIKQKEKRRGEQKGKTREYYKIGTVEYDRKQELKNIISRFEDNEEYQILKREVSLFEERLRNIQFGTTQFDTSITEQFSRISEYLHEITKNTTNYFLSKNNKSNNFPDISFEINVSRLADYYLNKTNEYVDFSISVPKSLSNNLDEAELQLLRVAVNSILSKPQGQLGNISEQNILEIIKDIGEHLPKNSFRQTLRDYYKYRIGKYDNFTFPENSVMANIITFLMKLNGHDQINKMLVARNINNRQIAFLFYGAYVGFANMPKTFTNIVFDSDNAELFSYIDNYLFNNYINQKP